MSVLNVAKTLSNLILVNPETNVGYQPQSETSQLPNFLFDIEGENSVSFNSDITDHFTEDNSSIVDHISLAPEKITVQGFVGELKDIAPDEFRIAEVATEKLLVIRQFEPELTATALIAYNKALQAYSVAKAVKEASVASWSGSDSVLAINGSETASDLARLRSANRNQTAQQAAFQQFYGYWRNRTLFTVQTPWAIFKNMAIESLRASQSADTKELSTFEITFKIIRFAKTKTILGQPFQSRSLNQSDETVDFGTYSPTESISLTSRIA